MSDKTSTDSSLLPVVCSQTAWLAVAGLLLLRLCIGWHFFSEGTKKLTCDEARSEWSLNFSAEPFLRQATGPLAGLMKNRLPGFHDWENLLATAKQSKPLTSTEISERQAWHKQYQRRRAAAEQEKKPAPIEFPDYAPYTAWANRIVADLRPHLKAFTKVNGISDAQSSQAAERFQARHQQLADFLSEEEESIAAYQHELWRLDNMQSLGGADDIPFRQQRVATKQSETSTTGNKLVNEVRGIEAGLKNDLRAILTAEQQENTSLTEAVESALISAKERLFHWMNIVITVLVIGVGVCFLLGLFTRLAAVGGALFLLSAMMTQLPWVPGANTTFFYYQLVECAAFLAILAYGAWRLPGLDYIFCGLWCGCCGKKAK